jgi:hypothetical protein
LPWYQRKKVVFFIGTFSFWFLDFYAFAPSKRQAAKGWSLLTVRPDFIFLKNYINVDVKKLAQSGHLEAKCASKYQCAEVPSTDTLSSLNRQFLG